VYKALHPLMLNSDIIKEVATRANKNKTASLLIRSGLAIVFIYAATSSLVTPQDWIIYLPHFATTIINANTLIKLFALYELVLAGMLISGKYVRRVGLASALTFLGIILSNFSLLTITFRDVALFFASLALVFIEE
jgi:hypothetical protein